MWTTSPKTGRQILVGGPTYTALSANPRWAARLKSSPKTSSPNSRSPSSPKARPRKTHSSPGKTPSSPKARSGCSNQGKYPGVPAKKFCGPEGGSCPGTYPVNTKGRARAALAYARHAPNPEGIKRCARRVAKEEGWF